MISSANSSMHVLGSQVSHDYKSCPIFQMFWNVSIAMESIATLHKVSLQCVEI